VKSKIKNGRLVIDLPLQKPKLSSTGKTLIIASTYGVQSSAAQYKGKPISIVANAFVYPDASAAKSEAAEEEQEEEEADE
jgi:hypothetical protein